MELWCDRRRYAAREQGKSFRSSFDWIFSPREEIFETLRHGLSADRETLQRWRPPLATLWRTEHARSTNAVLNSRSGSRLLHFSRDGKPHIEVSVALLRTFALPKDDHRCDHGNCVTGGDTLDQHVRSQGAMLLETGVQAITAGAGWRVVSFKRPFARRRCIHFSHYCLHWALTEAYWRCRGMRP